MSFSVKPQAQAQPYGAPQNKEPSARERALKAYNDPAKVQEAASAFNIKPGATNMETLPGREQTQKLAAEAFGLPPVQNNVQETLDAQEEQGQVAENRETESADAEAPAKPASTLPENSLDPAVKRFKELEQRAKLQAIKARQIQQQQLALKAQEDALKAREASIQAEAAKYQQGYISQDRLKQDPLSVLAEAGLSYDELTQQLLNQQPANPRLEAMLKRQEDKIRELESKLDGQSKSYQENQQQAYNQALKQIENDTKSLVKSDPAYEAIRATNSVSDVVDLIKQTYEQDGILLTVEEAAQQVEDYLVEEATKLTKLQKIKQRLQAEATKPVKQPSPQPQAQPKPQMKTLTNAGASSRPMTARERAIAAFKGQAT